MKMDIKFWYDGDQKKLMIFHISSQTRKEIECVKKINRFLDAYGLTREDCKGVREAKDRLGIFGKVRFCGKPW